MKKSEIIFGAGCFWGVDNIFNSLKGVISTKSGYSFGVESRANYKDVCSGSTDHIEVVKIDFNESEIKLDTLIEIFFEMHDPTTLNRQGGDIGTQYRSVISYFNEKQKEMCFQKRDEYQVKVFKNKKIVTEILPFKNFFKAEDYHQDYLIKNPAGYSCHILPSRFKEFLS
ncbi:peptide-methionine (S)-S-oxide reductase MsrA [bacterium]|nr:peptide-methionine (S)-S-oxide reductase MsrA [bacterium]